MLCLIVQLLRAEICNNMLILSGGTNFKKIELVRVETLVSSYIFLAGMLASFGERERRSVYYFGIVYLPKLIFVYVYNIQAACLRKSLRVLVFKIPTTWCIQIFNLIIFIQILSHKTVYCWLIGEFQSWPLSTVGLNWSASVAGL